MVAKINQIKTVVQLQSLLNGIHNILFTLYPRKKERAQSIYVVPTFGIETLVRSE